MLGFDNSSAVAAAIAVECAGGNERLGRLYAGYRNADGLQVVYVMDMDRNSDGHDRFMLRSYICILA